MKLFFYYSIALISVFTVHAQPARQECREQVRASYNRLIQAMQTTDPQKAVHIHCTVETVMNQPGKSMPDQETALMDIYSCHSQSRMITKDIEMYIDSVAMITVLPQKKSIHIASAPPARMREQLLAGTHVINDSLFGLAKVQHCTEKTINGEQRMEVVLSFEKIVQQRTQIESMVFVIDSHQTLKSTIVYYIPQSTFQKVGVIYDSIDTNYKRDELMKTSVQSLFFSGKELRPAYKGFTINDRRTKQPTKKKP